MCIVLGAACLEIIRSIRDVVVPFLSEYLPQNIFSWCFLEVKKRFINKWVCPATVLSFSLKASHCVGLSRKQQSWEKMSPRAHVDSAQQPIILLCVSYTTYVGKSDHVSQLSQLCQRLLQIKSFCFFTGSAFLQGVDVAQTQFCCEVVPALENTILLIASGQKKQLHLDLHSISTAALLWCRMSKDQRLRGKYVSWLRWKKIHLYYRKCKSWLLCCGWGQSNVKKVF